jgi:hypothetical protein
LGKGVFGVFGTNKEVEKEGRWFTITENKDGTLCRVKLRRLSETNERWQAALDKHGGDLRREAALDITISEERATPPYRKAFIETILIDWEHLQDGNGDEIPFTFENADAVLEQLPDFFLLLRLEASKLANFRNDAVDALAKK